MILTQVKHDGPSYRFYYDRTYYKSISDFIRIQGRDFNFLMAHKNV